MMISRVRCRIHGWSFQADASRGKVGFFLLEIACKCGKGVALLIRHDRYCTLRRFYCCDVNRQGSQRQSIQPMLYLNSSLLLGFALSIDNEEYFKISPCLQEPSDTLCDGGVKE